MGTYNIQNDMQDGDPGQLAWASEVADAVNDLDVRVGTGMPGASAYEIAVAHGYVGTEAAWLASLVGPIAGPADIAAAQGYWPIYSATPPSQTAMYGVPVVWIDSTAQLTPVPVLPTAPAWNDTLSQFTAPTVLGVSYVWTSGGGGIGQTITPGTAISTSGTYPRTVVITTVAQPGYVLASGVTPFSHDFPDPSANTLRTSDQYTTGTDFTARSTDAGSGGTSLPYTVALGSGTSRVVTGGLAKSAAGSARLITDLTFTAPIPTNMMMRIDILSIGPNVTNGQGMNISIKGVAISLDVFNKRIRATDWGGISTDFTNVLQAAMVGTWELAVTGTTLRIVPPGSSALFVTLTGTKPTTGTVRLDAGSTTSIGDVTWDNLLVYQVGA